MLLPDTSRAAKRGAVVPLPLGKYSSGLRFPRLVKFAQRHSPFSGSFTAPEIREARCSFPGTLVSIWGIGRIRKILRRKKIEGRKQTFRAFRYR
jgi:hypothetical protein